MYIFIYISCIYVMLSSADLLARVHNLISVLWIPGGLVDRSTNLSATFFNTYHS